MSGDFLVGGAAVPFTLTRVGDPKIEAAAKSKAIGKDVEGTWNGTLEVQGTQLRLVLTMANHPDGTATARIVNLDQGEVALPATITQTGASVTIETSAVVSAFSGALNATGTELAGTFTQGPLNLPLTFRRVAP